MISWIQYREGRHFVYYLIFYKWNPRIPGFLPRIQEFHGIACWKRSRHSCRKESQNTRIPRNPISQNPSPKKAAAAAVVENSSIYIQEKKNYRYNVGESVEILESLNNSKQLNRSPTGEPRNMFVERFLEVFEFPLNAGRHGQTEMEVTPPAVSRQYYYHRDKKSIRQYVRI